MKKADVLAFRAKLVEIEKSMSQRTSTNASHELIRGKSHSDTADEGSERQSQAVEFEVLEIMGTTIDQIRAAIERCNNGTFGNCDSCSKKIPKARLQAMPWAECCVNCARAVESGED